MLVQGKVRQNNAGCLTTRESASSSLSSRAWSSTSIKALWTGGKLCCRVQASQASVHIEHPILQAVSNDTWQDQPTLPNANGVEANWSYLGQASNSSVQPAKFMFHTNSTSVLPIPEKDQRSDVLWMNRQGSQEGTLWWQHICVSTQQCLAYSGIDWTLQRWKLDEEGVKGGLPDLQNSKPTGI